MNEREASKTEQYPSTFFKPSILVFSIQKKKFQLFCRFQFIKIYIYFKD